MAGPKSKICSFRRRPGAKPVCGVWRKSSVQSTFVGYESVERETTVAALTVEDDRVLVKLEESPFYPTGGGQIADAGWVECVEGDCRGRVDDAMRGRVLSLMMGLWFAATFPGDVLGGWLGGFWSSMGKANFFLMIGAIAATGGAAVFALNPALRSVFDERPAQAP